MRERGDEPTLLIRDPSQTAELEAEGEPVVVDLESADETEVAAAVAGADAVVFAAGAGPGSGSERKLTMDYGGAAKLIAAAEANGISRYVMVSAQNADPDAEGDDTFAVYLRAKGKADEELRTSGLDHTIVRPTGLTDEPGTGTVEIAEQVQRWPDQSRRRCKRPTGGSARAGDGRQDVRARPGRRTDRGGSRAAQAMRLTGQVTPVLPSPQ